MKKHPLSLACLATLIGLAAPASAAVSISDWQITANTLSFRLSGTVTGITSAPGFNADTIWLSQPGNSSWINFSENSTVTLTGVIDGYNLPATEYFVGGANNTSTGVNVIVFMFGDMEPVNLNFTDGINDFIDLTVTFTNQTPGKWNPAGIDPADLHLYWGGAWYTPDASNSVEIGLVVPEPSVSLSLAAAGLFGLLRRRR